MFDCTVGPAGQGDFASLQDAVAACESAPWWERILRSIFGTSITLMYGSIDDVVLPRGVWIVVQPGDTLSITITNDASDVGRVQMRNDGIRVD